VAVCGSVWRGVGVCAWCSQPRVKGGVWCMRGRWGVWQVAGEAVRLVL